MNLIPYGKPRITFDGATIGDLNFNLNFNEIEINIQKRLDELAKESTSTHTIESPKFRSTKRMRKQLQKKLKK